MNNRQNGAGFEKYMKDISRVSELMRRKAESGLLSFNPAEAELC